MQWQRFLNPAPSVTRWVVVLSGALVLIRLFVLFCESFSVVRSERLADDDLIELCGRGAAADSAKFRSLCLQAKADRAAPLIFKAVLRAIRTSFADFSECFSSPSRIAILVLFVVSGLALPVVKAVSALATAHLTPVANAINGYGLPSETDHEACEVVVLNGDGRRSWMNRLRPRHLSSRARIRELAVPAPLDEDDDEYMCGGAIWKPVNLGWDSKRD